MIKKILPPLIILISFYGACTLEDEPFEVCTREHTLCDNVEWSECTEDGFTYIRVYEYKFDGVYRRNYANYDSMIKRECK